MKSFTRTALGGAALLATSAAFPVAFTSAAHADPFTASCTGSTTLLSCTFTANSGFFFIDSQAADLNLSGTVTSASEVFSGGSGAVTASSITFNSPQNVDSLGSFNFTDDLKSGPGGNPTVSSITFTIIGTGLGLLPNADGNDIAAHICQSSTGGTSCATTFFSLVPGPVVGAGLPGLVMACTGLVALARRRRKIA